MVAPVEVDEVGVELLIRNELLQEHEVRDRHRLERINVTKPSAVPASVRCKKT